MRVCDICGGQEAYHSFFSFDICGECAPGIRKYIEKCKEVRTVWEL